MSSKDKKYAHTPNDGREHRESCGVSDMQGKQCFCRYVGVFFIGLKEQQGCSYWP
jgi:hypothetical protein